MHARDADGVTICRYEWDDEGQPVILGRSTAFVPFLDWSEAEWVQNMTRIGRALRGEPERRTSTQDWLHRPPRTDHPWRRSWKRRGQKLPHLS